MSRFLPAAASPQHGVKMWANAWARLHGRSPHLQFDAQAEREFRRWYANYVRARVRAAIWIPLAILLLLLFAPGPFTQLRAAWFGSDPSQNIDILRFGLVLPSTLAIFAITYTNLYHRYYAMAAQIVAPIHAASFIMMDMMMRPQGYALTSWLVLVVLGSYFMYGLLLHQGIRTALIVMLFYILMGLFFGLDSPQWRMDLGAIFFAATFAGYVFYSLHDAVRTHYIDHRNMREDVNRDALTGIHNRRMFDAQIKRLWQQAQRDHVKLGLLIVDIDHFKNYNDSLGHQAGDECLVRIAKILSSAARRPLDVAVRYGGEEFAILLYDADRQRTEGLCKILQADVQNARLKHPASPLGTHVTVSIGAACVVPPPGRSEFGFIQLADEALYAAKERGRNSIVVMDREYDTLQTGAFRSHRKVREFLV